MMTDRQLTLSSSSLLPLSSLPPSPSVPFLLFFPPSLSSPPFFLSLPLFFPSFSSPLLPSPPSPPSLPSPLPSFSFSYCSYNVCGFIDKNKDPIYQDFKRLLYNRSVFFLCYIFSRPVQIINEQVPRSLTWS